ncbi:MAG: hypothetical protein EZS28_014477, partial [Streblomastix strix]
KDQKKKKEKDKNKEKEKKKQTKTKTKDFPLQQVQQAPLSQIVTSPPVFFQMINSSPESQNPPIIYQQPQQYLINPIQTQPQQIYFEQLYPHAPGSDFFDFSKTPQTSVDNNPQPVAFVNVKHRRHEHQHGHEHEHERDHEHDRHKHGHRHSESLVRRDVVDNSKKISKRSQSNAPEHIALSSNLSHIHSDFKAAVQDKKRLSYSSITPRRIKHNPLNDSKQIESKTTFEKSEEFLGRLDQLKVQFDGASKRQIERFATLELLNELKEMLDWSLKTKKNENQRVVQLRACQILENIVIDNQSCADNVLQSGIIDVILSIINSIFLNQIQMVLLSPLFEFIEICNTKQKLSFVDKGFIPTMHRLLDSPDELCVNMAVSMIERILHASSILSTQGQETQIKGIIEQDGTIDKLVDVLMNDEYKDEEINEKAALAIGQAFKACAIPVGYRSEVILTIKRITNHEDLYMSSVGIHVLAGLAECPENHEDIISADYQSDISKFISQKYDLIVDYALQLVLNILSHGKADSKTIETAKSILPLKRIRELSQYRDPIISENAKLLIEILGN